MALDMLSNVSIEDLEERRPRATFLSADAGLYCFFGFPAITGQ